MSEATLEPQPITAEDLGRIPPAEASPESSGAEAARAAAEEGERSSAGEDPPAPGAPEGAAVLFVDMVLALGVQLAAQRSRVPFAQCAALAKLSEDERALLEQFAPYAAPYLGAVGQASPIVGALAFGGLTAMILAGRFRDVRAIAPPKPAKKPENASTSTGSKPVDLEHVTTWGPLADVVPPGTEVRDSGRFPDAGPQS